MRRWSRDCGRPARIPIAHTNLPDLLFAFESDNLVFGPTNNPYDLTRTSGGSSGGEAALIASCGSPMGLGSDAAGRVRLPAAFCGIAGIKPTSGRLPRTGHFPPAGRLDYETSGRSAPWRVGWKILHEAMRLLIGPDGWDATVPGVPFTDPRPGRSGGPCALRGIPITASWLRTLRWLRWFGGAAQSLAGDVAFVEEARPACLAPAYDLEMKLIGADGGDGLWNYLESLGSGRSSSAVARLAQQAGALPDRPRRLSGVLGGAGSLSR